MNGVRFRDGVAIGAVAGGVGMAEVSLARGEVGAAAVLGAGAVVGGAGLAVGARLVGGERLAGIELAEEVGAQLVGVGVGLLVVSAFRATVEA